MSKSDLMWVNLSSGSIRSWSHLHAGQVAAVSAGKPASAGALINVHILQIDINLYYAPRNTRTHTHTEHDINGIIYL